MSDQSSYYEIAGEAAGRAAGEIISAALDRMNAGLSLRLDGAPAPAKPTYEYLEVPDFQSVQDCAPKGWFLAGIVQGYTTANGNTRYPVYILAREVEPTVGEA